MALIGFWESSKTESIGDHKGIHFIGLLLIGVSPFEVSDDLWVKLIDGRVKGSQLLAGGQKIDQMEIEKGSRFCGYF